MSEAITRQGLRDPLKLAQVISQINNLCTRNGFPISVHTDFDLFRDAVAQARGNKLVSPMFDPDINYALGDHAFWMASRDENGDYQCLQSFRLDSVDICLANWVSGWMAGQYLKRSELVVLDHCYPPASSITWDVSGPLVYHGELWISPKLNKAGCVDLFPRLGMLLCHMKWQPKSIWALVGKSMATRGLMVRLGYAQVERSFLKWSIEPKGAEPVEWVAIANRSHLEFLSAELEGQIIDMSTSAMAVTTETPFLRSGNLCGSTTL